MDGRAFWEIFFFWCTLVYFSGIIYFFQSGDEVFLLKKRNSPCNRPDCSTVLWSSWVFFVCLFLLAHCQQCRIQRCNAEYVASTSPSSGLQEDVALDVDYCIALRAYAMCTRRQARSCRGDLVYHSAVFRIKELFSQHNCSSDGPTSSDKVPSTSRPALLELCNYENRVLVSGSAGQQKKYAHCGLFGDPHLRTFRDEFQTCKVEGAWPLIDNRFLSVQVTNVPVVLGSSATATSKVRITSEQLCPAVSAQLKSKKCPFFHVLTCLSCSFVCVYSNTKICETAHNLIKEN